MIENPVVVTRMEVLVLHEHSQKFYMVSEIWMGDPFCYELEKADELFWCLEEAFNLGEFFQGFSVLLGERKLGFGGDVVLDLGE